MDNGNGNGNGENGNGRLTGLQRAFVDAWFGEAQFNATEAARLAGYSGGDDPEKERDVWSAQGCQTLGNIKVKAEIERRWAAHGVTAEEVLATLTKQMRASPADFMDEYGRVDLAAIKENGRSVIKSVKILKGSKIEFQLESSQRAAELIGKTMRLFVDKQEITIRGDDVDAAIERELANLASRRQTANAGEAEGGKCGDG